jgi:hypothetical protein
LSSKFTDLDKSKIDENSLIRREANNSDFLRSLIEAVKQVNGENCCVKSLTVLSVKKILVEWVFGMSFDDHEESFVTLHNRK